MSGRLGALCRKELASLFGTPAAWLTLTGVTLVTALIFFDHLRLYNQILFVYATSTMGGFDSDANAVGAAIRASLPEGAVRFQTPADLREEAQSQLGTVSQIINAILGVAAVVGLLGLANTHAMSVLQRFREIGILRSVGVTRSQVRRMVLVESSTMGLVAFVLSLPLGWLLTFLVTRGSVEVGFTIDPVYPWSWIPFVFAFGLVISVVAAFAPGRRAARLEVVTALQYE